LENQKISLGSLVAALSIRAINDQSKIEMMEKKTNSLLAGCWRATIEFRVAFTTWRSRGEQGLVWESKQQSVQRRVKTLDRSPSRKEGMDRSD
jgi:hypothetical protein